MKKDVDDLGNKKQQLKGHIDAKGNEILHQEQLNKMEKDDIDKSMKNTQSEKRRNQEKQSLIDSLELT